MRRRTILTLLLALALAPAGARGEEAGDDDAPFTAATVEELMRRVGPGGALPGAPKYLQRSWYFTSQRLDLSTGEARLPYDPPAVVRAVAAAGATEDTAVWQPLGPSPIQVRERRFDDALRTHVFPVVSRDTGRIRDVAPHPRDPRTVYVGTAQGGVWSTNDGGAHWRALTDQACSPAVAALALDPLAPEVIFAGTGEPYYGTGFAHGCGLLRSRDGGRTWSELGLDVRPALPIATPEVIHRVRIDPRTHGAAVHRLYVATGRELLISDDDGETFRPVDPERLRRVSEVVVDPDDPRRLYAGQTGDDAGIYRSEDGGETWVDLLRPVQRVARVVMAVAPSRPSTVYAAMAARPGYNPLVPDNHLRLFKTTDRGESWQELTPAGVSGNLPSCRGQCAYDLTLAVAPHDPDRVFFGGVTLVHSRDGGATWQRLYREIALPGPQYRNIHPDFHDLAFAADGGLWLANDGGVFWSADGGEPFESRNGDLALTQFYSGLAVTPGTPLRVLGGSQDNGSVLRDPAVPGAPWFRVFGGDGGSSAVHPTAPQTLYVTAQWGSQVIYRATDGLDFETIRPPDLGHSQRSQFLPPMALDGFDGSRLLLGTDRVFESRNGGDDWSTAGTPRLPPPGTFSAVAFAPGLADVAYAGGFGNLFVRVGESWSEMPVPWRTSHHVTDLEVSPHNALHLFVAAGVNDFRVASTPDGGATWLDHTGNLPLTFVNALAVDWEAGTIWAATDAGVFASAIGSGTWRDASLGLPRVAVMDLVIDPAAGALVAATHGRGAFVRPLRSPPGRPLRLDGGRFHVAVEWETPRGDRGGGVARRLTEDTGAFWFFHQDNVELVVKVLDACAGFDRFWVFAAGLTDVGVTLRVTDLLTGRQRAYQSPGGTAFQPILDSDAFASCYTRGMEREPAPAVVAASPRPAAASGDTLELGRGRFRVSAEWRTADGGHGAGRAVPLTDDTGTLWFFAPDNVEMVVKVLDGCAVNGAFWVFAGGLTDVAVEWTVTDTVAGVSRRYESPLGAPFAPLQDTRAFATCAPATAEAGS